MERYFIKVIGSGNGDSGSSYRENIKRSRALNRDISTSDSVLRVSLAETKSQQILGHAVVAAAASSTEQDSSHKIAHVHRLRQTGLGDQAASGIAVEIPILSDGDDQMVRRKVFFDKNFEVEFLRKTYFCGSCTTSKRWLVI